MRVEASPFIVAGPAPADEVVGRHDVLAAIAERAARGRFVLLTAPRRYGKTTLMRRLAHDAEAGHDLAVVIVDLLGVQTHADIAVRMAQAWARLPTGALAKAAGEVSTEWAQNLDRRGKSGTEVLNAFKAGIGVK